MKPPSLLLGLVLTFLGLSLTPGHASHLLGADISWKSVGQDSFLVTVSAYRECSGEELVPPKPNVRCLDHDHTLNPPMHRVSEQTTAGGATCRKPGPPCSSPSRSAALAYQQIQATHLIDLSDVQCCRIGFTYANRYRPSDLTTFKNDRQKLFVQSWINTCKVSGLSARSFQGDPLFSACTRQMVAFRHKAGSNTKPVTAYDSVRYRLDTPLQSPGTPLSWQDSLNPGRPLRFEGFPDASKPRPGGFHLDPATGYLRFLSKQQTKTVIAIAACYYQDGKQVAKQQRDFVFKAIPCASNHPPIVQGFAEESADTLTTCAGDTTSFTLAASDSDPHDTARVSAKLQALPGRVLSRSRNAGPEGNQQLKVKWVPSAQAASAQVIPLDMTAKDQHCPINGKSLKRLHIRVLPDASADYTTSRADCRTVTLQSVAENPDNYDHQWQVAGDVISQQPTASVQCDTAGMLPLTHRMEAGRCERLTHDTLQTSPVAEIKGLSDVYCQGDTLRLKASELRHVKDDRHNVLFRWATGTGLVLGNQQQLTYSPESNKQLKLITRIYKSTGEVVCKDTAKTNLAIQPKPEVTLSLPDEVCANQKAIPLAPYGGPSDGQWLLQSGDTLATDSLHPASRSPGSYQMTYRYQDTATGCAATQTDTLILKAVPKHLPFRDTALCRTNQPLKLPDQVAGGFLQWLGPALNETDSGLYFLPDRPGPASGNVTLKARFRPTSDRCSYRDSLSIQILQEDQIKVPDQRLCPYDSLILPSQTGLPSQGYWAADTGAFAIKDSVIQRKPDQKGTYTADYYLNEQCRIARDVQFELIPEKPVSIRNPAAKPGYRCQDESPLALQAKPAGGQWKGAGLIADTLFDPLAAGPGRHQLTYQYPHQNNQCLTRDTAVVVVNQPPELSPEPDTLWLCPGQEQLSFKMPTAFHQKLTFQADGMGREAASVVSQAGAARFQYKPGIPYADLEETHKLIAKATGLKGCRDRRDTITVRKASQPPLKLKQTGDRKACRYIDGNLTVQSPDSLSNVQWVIMGSLQEGKHQPYRIARKGSHSVTVMAQNQYGCAATLRKPGYLEVLSLPDPGITSGRQLLRQPASVRLQATPQRSTWNYQWRVTKNGQGRASLTGTSPEFQPADTGSYNVTLTVKGEKRCIDSTRLPHAFRVLRKPVVYIPDAFTPDGDGVNDQFRVKGRYIQNFQLTIYSRSGAAVYQSDSFEEHGWNGAYQATELPQGKYWYNLTVTGPQQEQHGFAGTIQLIR